MTCVYHIYWISVNWSWNLSLSVLTICQWDPSKPDVRIYFPSNFVEGRGEGEVFLWLHLLPSVRWFTSMQFLNFDIFKWIIGKLIYKHSRRFFLLLVSIFIIIKEDYSFCWDSRFINITEDLSFSWGSRFINLS